jgi:RNA polymerase sigma-70 factor (ECF subfamily)
MGADSVSTSVTLLKRLQATPQDEVAWSDFAGRYAPFVFQWCRRFNLQKADAEDVTQTVLLRLIERMKTFEYDAQGSFRAWLRTVTYHAWAKFVGGGFQARRRDTEEALAVLDSLEARDDLAQRLEAAYDRELLDLAMLQVSSRVEPATWEAFRLLALDDVPGAEVATRLDMRVAAVYKARSRVQQMIQDELAKLDVPGV